MTVSVLKLIFTGTEYYPAASVRLEVYQLTTQPFIETHVGALVSKLHVAVYPHTTSEAVTVWEELVAFTIYDWSVRSETANEPTHALRFILNDFEYVVEAIVSKVTVIGTAYAPAASVRDEVAQLTTQELIETHAGAADPKVQVAVYPQEDVSVAAIDCDALSALTV